MRGVAMCPPGLFSVSGETSRRWLRAPELRDSLTQGSPQPRGGLASPDQPGCPSPFTVPGIKALALTGQLPLKRLPHVSPPRPGKAKAGAHQGLLYSPQWAADPRARLSPSCPFRTLSPRGGERGSPRATGQGQRAGLVTRPCLVPFPPPWTPAAWPSKARVPWEARPAPRSPLPEGGTGYSPSRGSLPSSPLTRSPGSDLTFRWGCPPFLHLHLQRWEPRVCYHPPPTPSNIRDIQHAQVSALQVRRVCQTQRRPELGHVETPRLWHCLGTRPEPAPSQLADRSPAAPAGNRLSSPSWAPLSPRVTPQA